MVGLNKSETTASTSLMDNLLGLLRIRVKKGINLAVRDVRSSDPYVVIKMGKQVLVLTCFFICKSLAFGVFICFCSLGLSIFCFILSFLM